MSVTTTHHNTGPERPEPWDCAVVIPTHPARGAAWDPATLLGRAVASVHAQTVPARYLCLALDTDGRGAGWCRQRALEEALSTGAEFVSFLDSDDTWHPHHLHAHRNLLCGTDPDRDDNLADVAYSWFDGNGIAQQWEATHRGKAWDPRPGMGHHITMTITVRAEFARQAADAFLGDDMHEDWTGEDWRFILKLNELGARFAGTGEVTWTYQVSHGTNTSGSPLRGDGPRAR